MNTYSASACRHCGHTLTSGPANPDQRLISAGIVLALLIPLAGIVIAIMLFFRDRVGPGIGVFLLSLVGIPVSIILWGLFIENLA